MLVHHIKNKNHHVRGKGFVKTTTRTKVNGKGLVEELPGMLVRFATNPQSSLNVGKAALENLGVVKKVVETGNDIKNAMKAAKKVTNLKLLDLIESIGKK